MITTEGEADIEIWSEQNRYNITCVLIPNLDYDLILGIPAIKTLGIAIDVGTDKSIRIRTGHHFTQKKEQQCAMLVQHENRSKEETWVYEEFGDLFNDILPHPPRRDEDHQIILHEGTKPFALQAYKVPFHRAPEMKRQIRELLEQHKIVESQSPFASPCLFVPKKDTSVPRLCCDYRRLNQLSVRNAYPMPQVEDAFLGIRGSECFSKLDLKSGYHQILVHPDSKKYTAFSTPWGHYEWEVMPFGLADAPATFMRLINRIFSEDIGKFVFIYFDDFLVYSRDKMSHREHLRKVLTKLRENKLSIHPRKSCFSGNKWNFWG